MRRQPGKVDAHIDAAIKRHQAGNSTEALVLYDRALALAPDHAEALRLSAIAAFQSGNTATALVRAHHAVTVRPDLPSAHSTLAGLLVETGSAKGAVLAARRATLCRPDQLEGWNNWITALERLGRRSEAVLVCRRCLTANPRYMDGWYNLGRLSVLEGDAASVVEAFGTLLRVQPKHPAASRYYALALCQLEDPGAEAALVRAINLNSADDDLVCQLADLLIKADRRAEARAVLDRGPATIDTLLMSVDLAAATGDLQQELAALVGALRIDPTTPELLKRFGIALIQNDDPRSAVTVLRRALALDPGSFTIIDLLARVEAAFADTGDHLAAFHGRARALALLRHALALQPDALSLLIRATTTARQLMRFDDAVAFGRVAVLLAPDNVEACSEFGVALQDLDRWADAEVVHRRAVQLFPPLSLLHDRYGLALEHLRRAREAEGAYQRAIALDPASSSVWGNLGRMYQWHLQREEATRCVRIASLANGLDLVVAFSQAMNRLDAGNLQDGWQGYWWRIESLGLPRRHYPFPLWDARPSSGADTIPPRLLIWPEQGVGDQIMFASIYHDVIAQAGDVVIECEPRMVSLFRRSFPGAQVLADGSGFEGGEKFAGQLDGHTAAGDLPSRFRPSLAEFPTEPSWLVPDPALLDLWRERVAALPPGLRIGIGWKSQKLTGLRSAAYSALAQWQPLFELPGVVLVNLQYGDVEEEIVAAEKQFGVTIHRWADLDLRDDFENAAALTANIDLVICHGTSTGELSAALGVPTWRIGHRDWSWLGTGVRPWYPAMRVLEPGAGKDWGDVIQFAAAELRRLGEEVGPAQAPAAPAVSTTEIPAQPPPQPRLDQLMDRAITQHRQGHAGAAEELCREILGHDGNHPVALHLLGLLLRRRGNAADAAETLLLATAVAPENDAAHAALADALTDLGLVNAAGLALTHAIAADPGQVNHLVNGSSFQRLQGNFPGALSLARRAAILNPTLGLAHRQVGTALGGLGQPQNAKGALRRSSALDPADAAGWNELALACQRTDDLAEASLLFHRALTLNSTQPGLWTNLGNVLKAQGHLQDALDCHQRALDQNGDLAEPYVNIGMALEALGRLEDAESAYESAIARASDHAQAHDNLGRLLVTRGQLRRGWTGMEWRFSVPTGQRHARAFGARLWRGENIQNRRLLIWREQGVGDECLFASLYAETVARAGKVVIETDRRLVSLFARSFPDADVRAETSGDPADFDVHIPAGSLPRLLRNSLSRFPVQAGWLKPDPGLVDRWQQRMAAEVPGLRVGIAWRSQLVTLEREAHYVQLADLAPLFSIAGVSLVNLQYGDVEAEIAEVEDRFGVHIHRWPDLDLRDDFENSAAVMATLDLVITPGISTGEFAAALGVPVWRFMHRRDWTFCGADVRPFYPAMRPFTTNRGSLADLIGTMARQLVALSSPSSGDPPPVLSIPVPEPEMEPDGIELLQQAAALHRAGDPGQAATLYRTVLALMPDQPDALHLAGLAAHQQGQSAAGVALIARSLVLRSDHEFTLASYGLALLADGQASVAVRAFRQALALAPASAEGLSNLGTAYDGVDAWQAAAMAYRRAYNADPSMAPALDNLGVALLRLGRVEEAMASVGQALLQQPTASGAWNNLVLVSRAAGDSARANRAIRSALALEPAAADVLGNYGRLLSSMGLSADALVWSSRALRVDPLQPEAAFNAGLLALAKGDLRAGWDGYARRFATRQVRGHARQPGLPEWRGEPLEGRRLLVWTEQGLGDEVMFLTALTSVVGRAAAVILECDPRLMPLYARAFPEVRVRPSSRQVAARVVDADCHCAAGDLARLTRQHIADFAQAPRYLSADPERAAVFEQRLSALGPGLRVGLGWTSAVLDPERKAAYTRLGDWVPLFEMPGIHVIPLQYGDVQTEVAAARRDFAVTLPMWADLDLKQDLEGVIALMSRLDLVIAPSSSVGELAAAAGVPTWRCSPAADWTMLGTGVRPWFDAQRILIAENGMAEAPLTLVRWLVSLQS